MICEGWRDGKEGRMRIGRNKRRENDGGYTKCRRKGRGRYCNANNKEHSYSAQDTTYVLQQVVEILLGLSLDVRAHRSCADPLGLLPRHMDTSELSARKMWHGQVRDTWFRGQRLFKVGGAKIRLSHLSVLRHNIPQPWKKSDGSPARRRQGADRRRPRWQHRR